MTREHMFPSTWREKLVPGELRDTAASRERTHTKYGLDLTPKSSHQERLFEVIVKPVCDHCNNGWMNDLDVAVEPWLLDPYLDSQPCEVKTFRRWATKVALLSTFHENPRFAQPGDLTRLYEGEDIAEWKVFVGRAMTPSYNHTFTGVGPIMPKAGGRMVGATQISWALGGLLFVAIRPARDDSSRRGILHMFRTENRRSGTLVAEVTPDALLLPDLRPLPPLSPFAWTTIEWFYSTNPLSPVSAAITQLERTFRDSITQNGLSYREV